MRDEPCATLAADLSVVVMYLKEIQMCGLWTNTQLLVFVSNCDVSVLQSKFDGFDPSVSCGGVLRRISGAKSPFEASQIARTDWADCVWKAEKKRIGEYPKDTWECFLSAHGMREQMIFDVVGSP